MTFIEQVEERQLRVGVVGLGYVGLPLMMEFADAGFAVRGFDVDQNKIDQLNAGETYIRHLAAERIQNLIADNPTADVTADFQQAQDCDALLICVPTPLTRHREPDLKYVEGTAHQLGPHLRRGQLIALESTTYPGTTEEILIPILEAESGLQAGKDFFVAYSPEREDPNNKSYSTRTIPKVVGGLDAQSLEMAQALYGAVICETVPVSSCRAAEATKLMENIFRSINIALVNELKVIFKAMDIDIWEVVNAARTKPFGYMPFYPGPGLGGHCIPIDPFYLTWKAKEYDFNTRFIELAGEINTSMPQYVVQQTMLGLNELGQALKGARILLVGLAYKKNVDDDRESPTYVLWDLLTRHGADVSYYDPFCPQIRPSRAHSHLAGIQSVELQDITGENFDAAVVSTAHDNVDHDALAAALPLVVDTRNACTPAPNVVKA